MRAARRTALAPPFFGHDVICCVGLAEYQRVFEINQRQERFLTLVAAPIALMTGGNTPDPIQSGGNKCGGSSTSTRDEVVPHPQFPSQVNHAPPNPYRIGVSKSFQKRNSNRDIPRLASTGGQRPSGLK